MRRLQREASLCLRDIRFDRWSSAVVLAPLVLAPHNLVRMLRARCTVPRRTLVARFRTQDAVTAPMPLRNVGSGGAPQEQSWKAGSMDVAFDVDPTANADPVASWSQTITVRLSTKPLNLSPKLVYRLDSACAASKRSHEL